MSKVIDDAVERGLKSQIRAADEKLHYGDPLTDSDVTALSAHYAALVDGLAMLGPEFNLAYKELLHRFNKVKDMQMARHMRKGAGLTRYNIDQESGD